MRLRRPPAMTPRAFRDSQTHSLHLLVRLILHFCIFSLATALLPSGEALRVAKASLRVSEVVCLLKLGSSFMYKITCEIVAEDRDAALSKLLALVNQGYDAMRENGDLPISWSIGDMKGNGEMRAGLFLPNT